MRAPITTAALALLLCAAPAAALDYVESSQGLVPPQLDGGVTEVEMGDVDADGHLDLVSIGDHGSPYINTDQHGVMVWFGDGTGGWSVVQYGNFGYGGVALGDADGDGQLDVGYGMHHDYSSNDLGDQLIEVALGDGTGTVWTAWDDGLASSGESWGMSATDFADVDEDGDLDLASVSFGCCAGLHVYLNHGDGTWSQSFGFLGGNSRSILSFADLNGDGHADLVAGHQSGTVYLGDGSGAFALHDANLPPAGSLGRRGVSAGDADGDGADDLAFANSQGGLEVWLWDAGSWRAASSGLPAAGSYEATQLCDMNGDGMTDLVAFGNGLLAVWTGDGGASWSQAATLTTPAPGSWTALRTGGDADHNGRPDIVLVDDEGTIFNDRNHLHVYLESTPASALAVQPVAPGPQRTLVAGAVTWIEWLAALPAPLADPATVQLELSTTGPTGPWSAIAAELPPAGRYQWQVSGPPSADCRIRYTVRTQSGATAVAVSAAAFHIAGGSTGVAPGGAAAGGGAAAAGRVQLGRAYPNPGRGPLAIELAVGGTRGAGAAGQATAGTAGTGAAPPGAAAMPAPARVAVYDASGRQVRTLLDGPPAAGRTLLVWDSRDARGRRLASGVYFIRLATATTGAGGHARPPQTVRVVRLR